MVALNQVIILFSLIIIGYIIKKMKIVSETMKSDISNLVIYITLPAFIISAMSSQFSVEILQNSFKLIVISFLMYGFALIFGYFYTAAIGAKGVERSVYRYIIAFSNCGFMGYPIVNAVLGKQGVFYTAIFNIAFTVSVWTIGIRILKGSAENSNDKMTIKATLKSMINPGLIAIIIGFSIFILQIELPYVLSETLDLLGSVTSPLSMMLIGILLSEVHLKEILNGWRMYASTIARLVLMPLFVYLILNTLGYSGYVLKIPVIIAGMPAAANTAIISAKYQDDTTVASKSVFITTLFSIITIPFIIGFLS